MSNMNSAHSNARSPGGAQPPSLQAAQRLEMYRFGGLKGLRRHNHFKEVRVADPFTGTMLHFPTPLHADNWLVSCFGRSLACTAPTAPLQAIDRGHRISVHCSLILETSTANLGDFVIKRLDERSERKWAQFRTVAQAHGLQPVLRTAAEIRNCAQRLQNLERMRQMLVQHLQDTSLTEAMAAVKRFLARERTARFTEIFTALEGRALSRGALACAAIYLYRFGAIDMNISEAAYGEQTRIQLL